MGRYNDYLLISDMDGTLLNSNKQISTENIVALAQFVEQGGKFSVATGRSQGSASRWLNQLPINSPCVFYNGSMVKDINQNSVLFFSYLKKKYFIPYIEWVLEHTSSTVVEIFTEEGLYLVSDPANKDPYLEQEKNVYRNVPFQEVLELEWIKILLCDEHKVLEVAEQQLVDDGIDGCCNHFYSQDFFFEITPQNSTKGTALSVIRNCDTYQQVKIIAVGDFENDIEMIEKADLGIAMGNANSNVKEKADYVTTDNNSHPMVDIIKKIDELMK